MIKLPTFPEVSADYDYDIELDGKIVNLRLTYNTRSDFWHLLLTIAGVSYGRFKITNDHAILGNAAASIPFSGDFFVFKTDNTAGDSLTYDNFGTAWGFYYLTADEVDAWRAKHGI